MTIIFASNKSKLIYIKNKNMNTLLIVSSIIFAIIWAVGLFVYGMGAIIHLVMVCAIFFVMLRILRNEKQLSI